MKAIINRNATFGTLNGVVTPTADIMQQINKHLKNGTAKLLVDTDETLMYELQDSAPTSNIHPIFQQALNPFGIK